MNPEPVLDQIADAILDGAPVDWSLVESNDATGPRDRGLISQLRTLETLRQRRRTDDAEKTGGSWTWGHLQVFERIGHGAYGDVYRAWDPRLDREVALKLLPSDATTEGPSNSLVIEEGRLLARVRHPNVVTIHGAERINGRVGLWMEFVKGRTLEEALKGGRTFTTKEGTRLGMELCRAVSAVHAAGLLHRDIKAQNIMLEEGGRLVLMDFGTGREVSDATDQHIAGTPLYLAPEVLLGSDATPQSDVYSLGVVLFRLLTNTFPVSGSSLADLRRAHTAAGGADARVDRAEIPQRLRRVLARALDADPARRYTSADDFCSALAASERTPAWRRMAYVAAAVAAIIAAAAAGWNLGLRERLSPALIALGVMRAPTIAVMPFTDAGSEPGHASFIEGLTYEVINDLDNIDGLQVRAASSSSYFKNRPWDVRTAGTRLRADYLVTATVKRTGNRLQLNAQLVRATDEFVMWSQPYDRTIGDVVAIQEDLARQIVNKLRMTLGRGQRRYQTNTAAHDLYLKGRMLVMDGGSKNAQEAVRLFEQVISIDPNFTPAHAGLTEAYAAWAWQLEGLANDKSIVAMRLAAERALKLDPMLAEAHGAMAITLAREHDWEGSRRAFKEALRLDPESSEIRQHYAFTTLLPMGEAAEAEELLTEALVFDPLSPSLMREIGFAQYVLGRYDDAIASFRQAFDLDPGFFAVNQMIARALIKAGKPEEAIRVFESRPGYQWERWILPAYVMLGRTADVARLRAENENDEPHRQAILWAALGDKDRTFDALNRTIETLPQRVAIFIRWPDFELLRGDERLAELERRLKLR